MSLGKVILYYLDIPNISATRLRGENVNLLLVDADVDYIYKRVSFDEWPDLKKKWEENGFIFNTLPAVEIEGKIYGNTAPAMRHISKKLGKYTGSNYDEEQYLDALSDSMNDWYDKMKHQYFKEFAKNWDEHHEKVTKKFLDRFNKIYRQKEGPYVLGEEISYVDFLTYHLIDDEQSLKKLDNYPNLKEFVATFEKRQNMQKYLLSLKDSN